ncbi:CLUMA_CG012693, isoform A [Clunio marinus]|uniref:CLUMA_CG012693, isoform A n=1 Tax=Clunio marinus TaxID=568069 RepID=A0A1J1IGG1_9DIPT|nr:CLUMA_CG012693, isoform A [Clunio marinus]
MHFYVLLSDKIKLTMEQNNSCCSSNHSSNDTDILMKIPNNFFDPNINVEKSHFSNDNDFMEELDNFLNKENKNDVHNSTSNDLLCYENFVDPLQQAPLDKTDNDLNLQEERLKRQHYEQLSSILQKKIIQLQQRLSLLLKSNNEKDQIIQRLKHNEGLDVENTKLREKKHTRSLADRELFSLKFQVKQAKDDKLKLQERHEKEKQTLETKQKKIFSNMMDEFSDKERKLLKELDQQRTALKNYYQTQLESALGQKAGELQEQLEQFQNEIKQEAARREKSINEKAIMQMELIVRKNEEEIDLLNQKCMEEVELYKAQLLNATRTIESLESKLNEYQIRRHDIAENLHSIMETQWRKTLEILTNPSRLRDYKGDPLSNDVSESDNNQQFKQEKTINNLSKSEENLKSELLRNYIDMLLKQSPKSDKANSETNSQKSLCKGSHRPKSSNSKPWK